MLRRSRGCVEVHRQRRRWSQLRRAKRSQLLRSVTVRCRRLQTSRPDDVRVNDPYKGVELVRRHGRPRENRHSLQIEVNRKLYMDEAAFERNPNFPRLKADLDGLVAALAGFARERAARA